MNTTPAQQLLSYEHKLKQQAWENLDSKIWFSLMTQYIDSLKTLGDNISDDVNLLVQERSHNAVQSLLLWFFYLVVMLAGTMVITHLFKESSSRQISRLTEAMQHLAHGKRSLRLRISEINDEISKMTEAYEINRKNLLKADIFTQLYMNQKEIELESRVRENKKLELMAFIDPLTSALNRRKFEELSQLELERSCRYKNNLCFLMLDIDYFKKINDTYGHAIGDEVLKHFTQACKNSVRNLDTVARMGGEEFVIMLPETDAHSSFKLAERIRRLIAESELNIQQKCIQYSVSIGVAQYDCTIDKNIESVLEHADTALYEAKKRGRNQVVLYEHSIS
jgi:diguanylate cyclase (GGDEF)-like protein